MGKKNKKRSTTAAKSVLSRNEAEVQHIHPQTKSSEQKREICDQEEVLLSKTISSSSTASVSQAQSSPSRVNNKIRVETCLPEDSTCSAQDPKSEAANAPKMVSKPTRAEGKFEEDSELREQLSLLLKQIKLKDLENSPLATDSSLTHEQGFMELVKLLASANKKESQAAHDTAVHSSRPDSQDTSPSITEALLNSTNRVKRNQEATAENNFNDDNGPCQVCTKDTTTKCTGCRKIFYCSKECQKAHWTDHKDRCRPYKVSKVDGFGKVLVATRAIVADEEILREKPYVLAPRATSDVACISCFKRASGKHRCPHCSWVVCQENCTFENNQHDLECNICRTAEVRGADDLIAKGVIAPPFELILTIRCLVAAGSFASRWQSMLERFGARHTLISPHSRQYLRHQQTIVEPLKKIFKIENHLGTITDAHIHNVVNILQVHSVPTRCANGEVVGLFPMASLLGHSCMPNTRIRILDKYLVVAATEDIAAGSVLTAMFTDILWGTKARRDHLQQTRFFSCSCRRCADPTELGSYFSALICPICPDRQPVLPTMPLVSAAPWACVTCPYKISGEKLWETNLSLGAEVSECLLSPSVEKLESLVEKWLPRVHSNHYHLHAIKHSLLQLYASAYEKGKKKDDIYWKQIAKKEKVCQEFLLVCSVLDPSLAHSVPQVGLAFYELHKSVCEYAKRNFGFGKLSPQQLKKKMNLAKALLRRSMSILENEAEDTPEGQLLARCQEDFIDIGKWMLGIGLV